MDLTSLLALDSGILRFGFCMFWGWFNLVLGFNLTIQYTEGHQEVCSAAEVAQRVLCRELNVRIKSDCHEGRIAVPSSEDPA